MGLHDIVSAPFRRAVGTYRGILQARMQSLDAQRVLEIGPGAAPLISCLDRVPNTHKHVIEFPGVIDASRQLGFQCLEQDIEKEDWAVESGTMDLVVSCMVLEHIANTDHVLRECHRVLRPGGHLLVAVPNQGALIYVLMLLFTLNPPMNMVSDDYYGLGNPLSRHRFKESPEKGTAGRGHLRLFSTRAMNDLLHVHGFKVTFNHGATWGLPVLGTWLAKIFPFWGVCTIALARKEGMALVAGPGKACLEETP